MSSLSEKKSDSKSTTLLSYNNSHFSTCCPEVQMHGTV